jgi:NAD(P)-dependent dehydrogenase (short-subunit alcohol dehydrogenase family)
MTFDITRVLVTGSSRGIGLATARAFLTRGARVAVNGRTGESVAKATEELAGGDAVIAVPGDLASVETCEAVVRQATKALGGLDVLLNNAGVYAIATMEETDEAAWDAIVDTSLKAAFFCSRAALPALRESQGSIVNIASSAGLMGFPRIAAYCAAKAGLVNMTRAMALELAPEVRVNCVCPGPVDTDMGRINLDPGLSPEAARAAFDQSLPVQRMGTTEEIAEAVVWLAAEAGGFVTGSVFAIDGGRTAGGPKRQSTDAQNN